MLTGPVSYFLALILAWLINEMNRVLRVIMTAVFYLPSTLVSAITIFTYIFSGDAYGLFNNLLMRLGIIQEPVLWLTDPAYNVTIVIIVQLWLSLGTGFLAFIAGLQGVDRSLYEAGAVDGVRNRWQELWYITLPSMRPQLMFGAIMSITGSFGFGGVVTALCGFPSVDYAAHTIIHHLERLCDMGYPVLLATSRKSCIGQALDLPTDQRVEGTMVTTVMGVLKGAAFVRVHDVKENLRAIRMTQAILRDGRNG